MTTILYIDADACPVKDEAVRVAERHEPGKRLSEVIRHARRRVIGETCVGRTNETGVIRIGRSAEEPARANLDLVPLDVIEPAILVGAAADWEHECGGPAVPFVALRRRAQGLDQFPRLPRSRPVGPPRVPRVQRRACP